MWNIETVTWPSHQLYEGQPENTVPTWLSSKTIRSHLLEWLVIMYIFQQLVNPPSFHVIKLTVYMWFTTKSSYHVIQCIDLGSTKQWIAIIKDIYSSPSALISRPLHMQFTLSGTYQLHPGSLSHPFLNIPWLLTAWVSFKYT